MARAAVLAALALTLAQSLVPPAAAAELARVVVRAGSTVPPNDPGKADALALAVALEPEAPPDWLRYPGDTVHYELAAGRLVDAAPPDGAVDLVRAGIAWRYTPEALPAGAFVELGPGMTLRADDRVNGRDQGKQLFFTGQITLGTHVGRSRRGRIALRWQHTSSAGMHYPNPGINLLMVELGYRWSPAH